MAECREYGKKLGILKGYHHPKIRKEWLFCKNCYDNLEEKRLKKNKN
jgi:hypothetical protein